MRNFFITVGAMALLVATIFYAAPARGEDGPSCTGVGTAWSEYAEQAQARGFDTREFTGDKAVSFITTLEGIIGQAPADLVQERVMVIDLRTGVVAVELGSKDCAQYSIKLPYEVLEMVIVGMEKANP